MSDTGGYLTTTGPDPFAAYGSKVAKTGVYLKFDAGDFLYGQNNDILKHGTRLVANMPEFRIGWRRWMNEEWTDLTMLLSDNPRIQSREELGDTDQSLWRRSTPTAKNPNPEPMDPWSYVNILEFSDGEQTYIYAPQSRGGIQALGLLCKTYGKERRMRPGMLPIVEIGKDSYPHKIKEYGRIQFPVFKIVGWTDENNSSVDALQEISEPVLPYDDTPPIEAPEPVATLARQVSDGSLGAMQAAHGPRIMPMPGQKPTKF